jgi:hypothetical protein
MARPHKKTVDYFSHDCVHGTTMEIIEGRFGNNGYAFWFKLLEMLGRTDGHYIELNTDEKIELLSVKTRLSVAETIDILGLLSRLNAIDKELWENKRGIWIQKFIDRVSYAYERRSVSVPQKPVIENINEVSVSNNKVSVKNLQQKPTNEMKLNEMKRKKRKTPLPDNFSISERVKDWASKNGHKNLEAHLESFKNKCLANGYEYIDFDAAFMTAIRENWGKIGNINQQPQKPKTPGIIPY